MPQAEQMPAAMPPTPPEDIGHDNDTMWRLAFALVACVARVARFAMARRPHQQVQAMTMQRSHRIGLRKSMQE